LFKEESIKISKKSNLKCNNKWNFKDFNWQGIIIKKQNNDKTKKDDKHNLPTDKDKNSKDKNNNIYKINNRDSKLEELKIRKQDKQIIM